jgi:bifunctional DNA-binding transcriptional regulator/antitoxin component of YhaV-PrlF toxin-antitoxin module
MVSADVEIVKMSSKGQLVVPQDIREVSSLNIGERFVAFPISEGVLFKKVKIPDIKIDFESLSKEIEQQFEKNDVKKEDIKKAIKWIRNK